MLGLAVLSVSRPHRGRCRCRRGAFGGGTGLDFAACADAKSENAAARHLAIAKGVVT